MSNLDKEQQAGPAGGGVDYRRRTAAQCLTCGPQGRLTRVPVVVREAGEVMRIRGQAYGPGGLVPVRARALRVSGLGRMLAAPRRSPATAMPAVVVAGVCLFLLAGVASTAPGGGFVIAGFAVLLGLVIGLVSLLRRRETTCAREVGRARWLWNRCWYCDRCGLVSLLAPAVVPRLIPARSLSTELRLLAGRLQWRATAPSRRVHISEESR